MRLLICGIPISGFVRRASNPEPPMRDAAMISLLRETNTELQIPNPALLVLLVSLSASYAAAQAAAEYGGAVSAVGSGAIAAIGTRLQPLTKQSVIPPQDKNKGGSLRPAPHPTEDTEATNRKALEARAGKDGAKLMLRSEPGKASVRIDGKPVGKTPLLLVVAPGVYKVEMEGLSTEVSRQQVDLLPKETREVVLALESRYPSHVQLRWHTQ
jgi:hypothetical protein